MMRMTREVIGMSRGDVLHRGFVHFAFLFLLLVVLGHSVSAHAGLVDCLLARCSDDEAVRLKLTTEQDGEATITIGTNVITFIAYANEELDTGWLLIRGDLVEIDVFSDGVLTDQCMIPVNQISEDYEAFCCGETPSPTITVSTYPSPNANGWNNQTVTVTITAQVEEDGAELKAIYYQSSGLGGGNRVEVSRDELALQEGGRIAEFSLSLSRYDGSSVYDIECWAVDIAGNESTRESVTLMLDYVMPTVELATSSSGGLVTVSWEVSDELSGLGSYSTMLTQGSRQYPLSSSPSGETILSPDEYDTGTFDVVVRAIDRAGNESSDSKQISLTTQACSITGQVVDSTTDQPISGITVELRGTGMSQTTDNQGYYTFSGLPANRLYTLYFSKVGVYKSLEISIESCPEGSSKWLPVRLTPEETKAISISWSENPSDAAASIDARRGETVVLYLRAAAGSQWYLAYDLRDNAQESRAFFMGVRLGLSEYMKTPWNGSSTGTVVAIEIPASAFSDDVVDFQAIVILANGSVEISEVIALRITD